MGKDRRTKLAAGTGSADSIGDWQETWLRISRRKATSPGLLSRVDTIPGLPALSGAGFIDRRTRNFLVRLRYRGDSGERDAVSEWASGLHIPCTHRADWSESKRERFDRALSTYESSRAESGCDADQLATILVQASLRALTVEVDTAPIRLPIPRPVEAVPPTIEICESLRAEIETLD